MSIGIIQVDVETAIFDYVKQAQLIMLEENLSQSVKAYKLQMKDSIIKVIVTAEEAYIIES